MSKCYWFVLMLVIVCFVGGPAAHALVPATASLYSFDPATSTYVYEVIQGITASQALTDFHVMAFTHETDPYTMTNPSSGGSWMQGLSYWDPDNLIEYGWYNGFVPRGSSLGGVPWVGYFTLTVPGTQPVPGTIWVMTPQQVITSYSAGVPGFVPEPSGVAALGVMLLGIGPMILRLRKR